MDWKEKLISLYLLVSESEAIKKYVTSFRQSNNYQPDFTDEEVITIYLFSIMQKQFTVKDIHQFAFNHLLDWFPKMPKYEAFNARVNQLCYAFELIIKEILSQTQTSLFFKGVSLIDSMPIIVAKNSRSSTARTAKDICNKGYCSSKDMYYYGVKFHFIGHARYHKLPMPECFWITPAEENDLTAARPVLRTFSNRIIMGDKIYADAELCKQLRKEQDVELITPIKKKKGQSYIDAADELYSTAVSKIRQPIESFFNWINEMTSIQVANKIRSKRGLLAHVFGKLAVALIYIVYFNS